MFTRSEDRVAEVDLKFSKQAPIADYWCVWDQWSRNMLIDQGLGPSQVFLLQPTAKKSTPNHLVKSKFLLLLSHQTDLNGRLLKLWCKTAAAACSLQFAIRTHPICPLSEDQLVLLSQYDYEDISAVPMQDISFHGCVAISIHSTSAIQAAGLGCGVIWAPFITEEAMLVAPAILKLGAVSQDEDDFVRAIESLMGEAERQERVDADIASYNRLMRGEDQSQAAISAIAGFSGKS